MEHIDHIEELVKDATSGTPASFKILYEHLVDKVFSYVRYRANSEDDATDITQDIFIDIYKSLPAFSYTSKEQFYGFVFTITKRKLAKYYGNKHTQATKSTSEFDEDHHAPTSVEAGMSLDVAQALTALDEVAREIVVLHHWSLYTFPEIASLIDMTESAVRVRHHRALKTLSASLQPQ